MKKNKINKIIVALLLSAIIIFVPLESVRADAWGANYSAAILKQTMEQIAQQIHGAIMGALKQAAVQTINSSVSAMISGGGGSGGALFITNWNDYLVSQPLKKTELYMNDFFTLTTRGSGSSSNYLSSSRSGEGISGNYTNYLVEQAKKATTGSSIPQTNISEYVSDPSEMFSAGNWRGFSAFVSNPANNPFGYTLMAQSAYQEKLEQEKDEARIRAMSYQGYTAKESNGNVITPGSAIASMQAGVQDLGNKIIASAQNIPEVITAVVTRIATNAIRQGIGNAQRNVQREINNVVGGVRRDVNEAVRQSGPGTIFKPSY
ncbi:MAG: hypothetical protein V1804_02685 [Patescibacteria group bacterium]